MNPTLILTFNSNSYTPSMNEEVGNLLMELERKRILWFNRKVRYEEKYGVVIKYELTPYTEQDRDMLTEYNLYKEPYNSVSSFLQYLRRNVPLIITHKYLFSE